MKNYLIKNRDSIIKYFIIIFLSFVFIGDTLIIPSFAYGFTADVGNINETSFSHIQYNLINQLNYLYKDKWECEDLGGDWCLIDKQYTNYKNNSLDYEYNYIYYIKEASGMYGFWFVSCDSPLYISYPTGSYSFVCDGNYSYFRMSFYFDEFGNFTTWRFVDFGSGFGDVPTDVHFDISKILKSNHNIYDVNGKLIYLYRLDFGDLLNRISDFYSFVLSCIVSYFNLLIIHPYFLLLFIIPLVFFIIKFLHSFF